MTRKTKTELTMDILKMHGRVTEAMGHAVHGRYHVGGAIFRLRNQDRHLIPAGKKIVTVMRTDVNGNDFAEWRLVDLPFAAAPAARAGLNRTLQVAA
jgi:hypothetical protein